MVKFSFNFSKAGYMKYISHLDLMRLFTRALRRAGFAVKMTQGFSPHPKFSINRALKLGLESQDELAAVSLRESLDTQDFQERLQEQMPEGITIKQVYEEEKSRSRE
jgi:radical SAM-linked protein